MSGHEMRQLLDVVINGVKSDQPQRSNLNENAMGGTTQKVYDGLMRLAKNPNFDPEEHQQNVTYLLARHKGPLSVQELAQKFEDEYGMDPWHYAKQLKQEMSDDFYEEAPEGWEGTVKGMKDEEDIDNPYALAHWMQNQGYESHKNESALSEKAKSKNQQQAAGMALAAKRGEMPVSELQGAAKQMYDGMTKDELEDYAETEHEGLPNKVEEDEGREWEEEHWGDEMYSERIPRIRDTMHHPEYGTIEVLRVTDHDEMGSPAAYLIRDEQGQKHEVEFDELFVNAQFNEDAQLNEDMGELQQIEPALRYPFQMFRRGKGQNITHGKLGRGSPVWEVKPTNAMDAWRMLQDMMAEEKPMGMVLRIGGDQVYSVFKADTKTYNSPSYRFAFDTDWWKNNASETDFGKKIAEYRMDMQGDAGENKVLGHIRGIVKAAKTLGQGVDALVVGEDLERAQKQKQRSTQKRGRIEEPSSEKFWREARKSLRNRLDRYKASKAQQFDTPEEFVESIKNSGILDKVNIGGFTYTMRNENLRLDSLLGRDRMGQEAYIDYQLDDFMKAMDHQEETGERIPDKITVTFKLDGMQLVPTGVKTNR